MLNESVEVLSWLLVLLFAGAVIYSVDRRVGVKLFRVWYRLTHRDPLPDGVETGFVYGQKAQARFTVAFAMACVQTGVLLTTRDLNPFIELVTFFAEIPVVMAGFYLGPYLDLAWARKDNFLATVDKVEQGEISISKEIVNASKGAVVKAKEALDEIRQSSVESDGPLERNHAQPIGESSEPTEQQPHQPSEAEARAIMKRFIRD